MRNIFVFLGALLLVDGVFGVDETLSVMEGDSVTLKPHTEITEDDTAMWFFGEERIARMNKAAGLFSTSDGDEVGFKGKLKLDKLTGSLTITNTRTEHTGLYKVKISGDTETSKTFNVTVRGDVVESVSVVERDTVTLHTGVTGIQRDEIQWFGDRGVLIADLNGAADASWSNTDLNDTTGDLTIRNIRNDQYGHYEVKIKNKNSLILHRKFRILGVFGDDVNLSVMEGDSVTLNPHTEILEDDSALWWFGDKIIAKMKKADGLFSTFEDVDGRFKGKLDLDNQTGSLTITNIRTEHTGLYKLQIRSTTETFEIFSVTVSGDVVESVSVMEADTVTLHTGVTGIQRDEIQWKFGDQVINTDRLNGAADASWSNTDLNNKTGDLTIRNIRRDQYGHYEVKMKNKNSLILHRKFRIRTLGVFGDDVNLSVMEGDSVTLNPHTEILEDDSALWWFGDKIIAKMKKADGLFSTFEDVDGRFKGKLDLDHQTGSLTITNIRTEHTGLYKLQIRSTTETFEIFSVTVSGVSDKQTPDPGVSPGAVAGIVVGVLLLLLAAVAGVIYHRHKISKLKRFDAKENGTNDHLNTETANSVDL